MNVFNWRTVCCCCSCSARWTSWEPFCGGSQVFKNNLKKDVRISKLKIKYQPTEQIFWSSSSNLALNLIWKLTPLYKTVDYSVNIHPWHLIFWISSLCMHIFHQKKILTKSIIWAGDLWWSWCKCTLQLKTWRCFSEQNKSTLWPVKNEVVM